MKGAPAVLAVLFTLSSTAVHAQTPPPLLVQADISGSLGWLNVNKTELESYNDWYNRSLQGAATFGWYWTNHLKTEVEVSASTRAELYAGGQRYVGGTFVDSFVEHRFSTRRVTLGQLYQFGRNAWFHPHAGAGIDVNRERQSRDRRATTIYDPATRQTRVVQDRAFDATTDVHVRPFGTLGFKAYMTPRAFFRSDLRIVGARRLDEVVLRFGLGVDF